jgi:hypothetical protein
MSGSAHTDTWLSHLLTQYVKALRWGSTRALILQPDMESGCGVDSNAPQWLAFCTASAGRLTAGAPAAADELSGICQQLSAC